MELKFIWDDYHEYSDGSKSISCECEVLIDDKCIGHLYIDDYTTDDAINKGKSDRYRKVYYGFEMHDTLDIHDRCWSFYGLDKNEVYGGYYYQGTPTHTIDEVKQIYEQEVCDYFKFDYNKELETFLSRLNERKEYMDAALRYESTMKR